MNFTLQTTDIDLGDTPIENIFINDFMPMANGTYVKVYLLGYKYAHDKDLNIEVDNKTIAKHLNIPLTDVLGAWDFWKQKGIIEKISKQDANEYDYKVKFLNLKQLYIKNNYRPVNCSQKQEEVKKNTYYSCDIKDVIEANTSPVIQKMFSDIQNIVKRNVYPNERHRILDWICNYNLNPDIVVKAFFYCVEMKGVRSVFGVERIIKKWYNMGITNVEGLMEHFKNKNKKIYSYERIMKSLGFRGRCISEGERKVVDKWIDEYKFSIDLILKACENTKKTSNPSINYIDGILSSWYSKGIKNVDEIEQKDKQFSKKYKPKRGSNKAVKTRFHNFEQRTSKYTADQLERIARKKREEYFLKIKGE